MSEQEVMFVFGVAPAGSPDDKTWLECFDRAAVFNRLAEYGPPMQEELDKCIREANDLYRAMVRKGG